MNEWNQTKKIICGLESHRIRGTSETISSALIGKLEQRQCFYVTNNKYSNQCN